MPSFCFGVTAEVLLDEGRSEAVKAGGHRRVGGEEIAGPRDRQRDFEGLPGLLHETAGALQTRRRPHALRSGDRPPAGCPARASSRQPPIPSTSSCLRRSSGPPP